MHLKQKHIYLLFSIIFITLSGCVGLNNNQQNNTTYKNNSDLDNINPSNINERNIANYNDFTVYYTVTNGFTGWVEAIVLYSNGTIVYRQSPSFLGGERNETVFVDKLDPEELRVIKNCITSEIWSYKGRYDCGFDCPTDLPTISLSIVVGSKKKTITLYYPREIPQNLETLLTALNDLRNNYHNEVFGE